LKETIILSSLPIPSFFLTVTMEYQWESLDLLAVFKTVVLYGM
jgi:hypothetical protein